MCFVIRDAVKIPNTLNYSFAHALLSMRGQKLRYFHSASNLNLSIESTESWAVWFISTNQFFVRTVWVKQFKTLIQKCVCVTKEVSLCSFMFKYILVYKHVYIVILMQINYND